MRRILLIVAMLLPVVSAMAATPDVTITATVSPGQFNVDGVAHKTVTIGYTGTVDVRAFALDINVDNGMNIADSNVANFLRGESPDVNGRKGYGIFPGRFRDFINPTTPDWDTDNNYMPVTPWNSPGAEDTGLGYPKMVVELGTLYKDEPNKPALSGTLFSFDVNSEGSPISNDCNLNIVVNALRGGIVGSDAAAITATNLPYTTKVTFAPAGVPVPDCVGLNYDRSQCIAALTAAGLNKGVEVNVPGTGQAMRKVIAQWPLGGASVPSGSAVDFNAVSWPMKPLAKLPGGADGSLYTNWIARGRPACWAYPRQCRGDGDGKKQGLYWVASSDLNIWKSAQNKVETLIPPIPGGICGDFNHSKQGLYWVASSDLSVWKSFQNKVETLVSICGNIPSLPSADPNYHYWCLPTGTTTCPAGQQCAPVGTCPNSP